MFLFKALKSFDVNDVALRPSKIVKINFFTLIPELDIQYSVKYL